MLASAGMCGPMKPPPSLAQNWLPYTSTAEYTSPQTAQFVAAYMAEKGVSSCTMGIAGRADGTQPTREPEMW